MDQYEQPVFHFWGKRTLKASCLHFKANRGALHFRELNEKIPLDLSISKMEWLHDCFQSSFLHLPHNSAKGEKAGVLWVDSPTHVKSSAVYYKGKTENQLKNWKRTSKTQEENHCHPSPPLNQNGNGGNVSFWPSFLF